MIAGASNFFTFQKTSTIIVDSMELFRFKDQNSVASHVASVTLTDWLPLVVVFV